MQPERQRRNRAWCAWIVVLTIAVGGACGGTDGRATGPAAPSGIENTVRWTTASEVDNYGFDVYRSTAEDGPLSSRATFQMRLTSRA